MSFKRFVPLVTLLAVFTMALRFSIGADTYWHLSAGEWILAEGDLPRMDPFSLTRFGAEWIYPGWLAQVILLLVHRALGFPGLNLLTALGVTATFGIVWATMRGRLLLKAFVLLFAATVSAVYWAARPHIFTLLFTAITLWSLAKFRRSGSRAIWIIPPLTVIWANVHGGFAIPILLIGLEAASALMERVLPKLRIAISKSQGDTVSNGGDPQGGWPIERLRVLLGVGLLSIAAVLVNPFGTDMLAYPFRTVSIEVLQNYIQEWQSPDFHRVEVQPFLWMLLLLLASMALSPKRPASIELLHVGVLAYISFLAARNIPLFALVAAPVLSSHMDALLDTWLPGRVGGKEFSPRIARGLNISLVALISIAAVAKGWMPLSKEFNRDTIADTMPAQAVEFIRANRPDGPLLNSYNWGGYVLWSLHPDYLSFVDGRTDLFDDAILEEYLDLWRGEDGWESAIERWGIRVVLIETDAPLAAELSRAGWNLAFEDEQASVFTPPE